MNEIFLEVNYDIEFDLDELSDEQVLLSDLIRHCTFSPVASFSRLGPRAEACQEATRLS